MSSDGTHVWVANSDGDTVSEIDASTGTVVNTIPVGSDPLGVSSDGTHVWVTNYLDGTVSEIDASTGTVVNTIPVGSDPDGVSSDGTHVWVANSTAVRSVRSMRRPARSSIRSRSAASPSGVSSDGTHVWVANYGGGTVSEIDASTGTVVNTIPVGSDPSGVSSDGTHVWVANNGGGTSVRSMRRPARSSIRSRSAADPESGCRRMAPTSGSRTRGGTVSEISIVSVPDIVATPDARTRSTSATFEFTSDQKARGLNARWTARRSPRASRRCPIRLLAMANMPSRCASTTPAKNRARRAGTTGRSTRTRRRS